MMHARSFTCMLDRLNDPERGRFLGLWSPLRATQAPVEAAPLAGVAGGAIRLAAHHQGVAVAVVEDAADVEVVAGRVALLHQPPLRPAVAPHPARLAGGPGGRPPPLREGGGRARPPGPSV